MNGYVPHNLLTIGILLAALVAVLVIGFALTRLRRRRVARMAAWLLVIGAVVLVERLTVWEPAGVRMLAIITALLWAMKTLVSIEEEAAGRPRLGPWPWFFFAAGWPGMRPSTFAAVPGPPRPRSAALIGQGAKNFVAGAAFLALAYLFAVWTTGGRPSSLRLLLSTTLLLPGLSLMLHFGLFHMLAGLWRRRGGDCHALFRAPLKSTSLSEFWGRRWNLAFSEMTALAVFRPLRGVVGPRAATLAAFLFSGLLHELAISVPARAGYGLPLLYFALQAAAMELEGALSRRGLPVDSVRWVGRLWTLAWLVLPLPILFHLPFLRGCVWPLIGLNEV